MGVSDLATRHKAIPFRANWYDQFQIGNQFPDVPPNSDLYTLNNALQGANYIRIALPYAGDLVECRFTMQALNTSADTQIRLAIGRFAADGINVDSTQTAEERTASTKLITGDTSPMLFPAGTPILIDGINLLKAMPKPGDPHYSPDGFVLYVGIAAASFAGWALRSFKVDGSVQMGVL